MSIFKFLLDVLLQVLTIVLLITAIITFSVNRFSGDIPNLTHAALAWLTLVTIITIIIDGFILAARFLNFAFAVTHGSIIHIVVSSYIICTYNIVRNT